MERSKIAIIIPVYNEEKTIKNIIKKVKFFGYPVVINDNSTDGTKNILKELKIKYLDNKKNLGYEKSLKKGLIFAKKKNFQYFITIDGDDQHNVFEIKKIIILLKKYDLVFTVRDELNRFSERFFSLITNIFYDIKDPLSGLKGYRKNILNYYKFKNWNNSFGSDLLLFAKKEKFKVKGIKTKICKRKGKSRVGNDIFVNLKILKLSIHFFKNYIVDKMSNR